MGTRGRKSAASLSIAPAPARVSRLEPPEHLSEAARAIWRDVVRTEAVDHFDRGAMMQGLERYAELTAAARAFEAELAALPAHALETRMKLAKLVSDLGARASALALRLRLTPASRERTGRDEGGSPYDSM